MIINNLATVIIRNEAISAPIAIGEYRLRNAALHDGPAGAEIAWCLAMMHLVKASIKP